MRIDSIDLFYLAMPVITTEADGSQDALLVRVVADNGRIGWGECEASPLTSIAAFVAPMSHGACRPVSAAVMGERIDSPADIARIARRIEYESMDLLQAPHTWSGIEVALWDLLGRTRGEPVWKLLGYSRSEPKLPYASVLFGDTPQQTLERAKASRRAGFTAGKFGWGPIGRGTVEADADQFRAAREGLGHDGILLVDVGQIFGEDVAAAAARLPALEAAGATWLEEPFSTNGYDAYAALSHQSGRVRLAGGEGAHNPAMARHLIDHGGVGFIQVDCGRIGGIGPAKAVADHAVRKGITYVNHTFTSNLALSASLQPFAGLADHRICEFPTHLKPLAVELTGNRIERAADGTIAAPDAPGLGIDPDPNAIRKYSVDVEIRIGRKLLHSSPKV